MLGPLTAATIAKPADHIGSSLQCQLCDNSKRSYILLLLTIYFKHNSKKGFNYSNSVYVYLIIIMITGSMELRILLSVFI